MSRDVVGYGLDLFDEFILRPSIEQIQEQISNKDKNNFIMDETGKQMYNLINNLKIIYLEFPKIVVPPNWLLNNAGLLVAVLKKIYDINVIFDEKKETDDYFFEMNNPKYNNVEEYFGKDWKTNFPYIDWDVAKINEKARKKEWDGKKTIPRRASSWFEDICLLEPIDKCEKLISKYNIYIDTISQISHPKDWKWKPWKIRKDIIDRYSKCIDDIIVNKKKNYEFLRNISGEEILRKSIDKFKGYERFRIGGDDGLLNYLGSEGIDNKLSTEIAWFFRMNVILPSQTLVAPEGSYPEIHSKQMGYNTFDVCEVFRPLLFDAEFKSDNIVIGDIEYKILKKMEFKGLGNHPFERISFNHIKKIREHSSYTIYRQKLEDSKKCTSDEERINLITTARNELYSRWKDYINDLSGTKVLKPDLKAICIRSGRNTLFGFINAITLNLLSVPIGELKAHYEKKSDISDMGLIITNAYKEIENYTQLIDLLSTQYNINEEKKDDSNNV